MADPWQIRILDQQQTVYTGECVGAVELGRQEDISERIYSKKYLDREGRWRMVIAGRDEDSVSRQHVLMEPVTLNRGRITNLSKKVSVGLPDGARLDPAMSCELDLPAVLVLGRKTVRVQLGLSGSASVSASSEGFRELEAATRPPGSAFAQMTPLATIVPTGAGGAQGVEFEEVVHWLRATMGVLQSAATSSDFFEKAAQAAVDIVGLDTGWVLVRRGAEWVSEAARSAPGITIAPEWKPSRRILEHIARKRKTAWEEPDAGEYGTTSLVGVGAVVAAPILNESNEVIGALYGDRRSPRGPGMPPPVNKLDAMLIELLASGVAAGLARLEMEQKAVAAKVQFEQFFTPELARVLESRPDLLTGQDAEITVLFCDIRGFSRVSAWIGAEGTVRWINNVMEALSECVLAHRGVLVDYIGDELMAMWGAPLDQPDHAQLASIAALDMIERLPELNRHWQPVLGEPMDVGIGLNTGIARVGNTGTQRKFKYGPLGPMVNLASRVQGMTKYLKAQLLLSEATAARLGPVFPGSVRRIGKVRVVNIAEPVQLFELATVERARWDALRVGYEQALSAFEARDFRTAVHILGSLVRDNPDDGPSLVLLSRAVQCLVEPDSFDPVYAPPGK